MMLHDQIYEDGFPDGLLNFLGIYPNWDVYYSL